VNVLLERSARFLGFVKCEQAAGLYEQLLGFQYGSRRINLSIIFVSTLEVRNLFAFLLLW